jgi:N-methylhydantoinase A
MTLDEKLAQKVIEDEAAKPLGISVQEAAFTIWNTVNVNMTDAIRTITSWEGIDPREYTFVSGGGAAGMHIIPMMADLGVRSLIIPKAAGVLSAFGGLSADTVGDFQRSFDCNSEHLDFNGVNEILGALKKEGLNFLNSNGIKPENQGLEYYVDASYLAQPWLLTIPLGLDSLKNAADVAQVVETFHAAHDRIRGSREEGQFVEFYNWRVKAVGKTRALKFHEMEMGSETPLEESIIGKRKAFFKDLGGMVDTTIYNGDKLTAGNRIEAPAIIEEVGTTIVVFPGSTLRVSSLGNYVVERTD